MRRAHLGTPDVTDYTEPRSILTTTAGAAAERPVRTRHARAPSRRARLGVGQVQSAIGDRVTVNFEHAGKRLINTAVVTLVPVDEDSSPRGR